MGLPPRWYDRRVAGKRSPDAAGRSATTSTTRPEKVIVLLRAGDYYGTRKIGFLGNNRFAEIGGRSMLDDADVVLCVPCSATWRAVFPDVCRPIFRSRFQPQPRHLGC